MPKISVLVHTASPDHFLAGHGIPSYFTALVTNLGRQTFTDFELVYVDTYYEKNAEAFAKLSPAFQVKHVAIHPWHRYWYDKGWTYISAAKNTGILYADGELCVSFDDAEFFPDTLLAGYWDYRTKGQLLTATHKRMKSINTQDGFPVFPIDGDIYVNDPRMSGLFDVKPHTGVLAFAGTSFPLEETLAINGFNERMDGCKSLEDCEFGERLTRAQRSCKFVCDPNQYLYIVDHVHYNDAAFEKKAESVIAIENYGVIMCMRELKDYRANTGNVTDAHLKIIQRETLKYRNFDPLAAEHKPLLDLWLGVPAFDLRSERKQLRKSQEWRWR